MIDADAQNLPADALGELFLAGDAGVVEYQW